MMLLHSALRQRLRCMPGWRLLRQRLRSDRGVAAIELVIVLPLAMIMMLGYVEIYLYMRAQSTVEHTAFTLADSVAQMTNVFNDSGTGNSNTLGSVWQAATLLAAPLDLESSGGVAITSVCDSLTTPCGSKAVVSASTAAGTAKIWWQESAPWNAKTATTRISSSALLPASWPFRTGDSALVIEVFYVYDPFPLIRGLWPTAPGTQTIYKRVYVRPRANTPLTLSAASSE